MSGRCPFCAIVRGEDPFVREIARNSEVVVFFPTEPAVLGHCMVIPRRHAEEFTDLTSAEVHQVMIASQAMARSVQQSFHPDGINIIQSNGEAASQSVPHVHVHVLPRWKQDPMGEIWPPDSDYSDEEKDQALAKLYETTILPIDSVSAEDRRQHLSLVQSVIARMAQSSANIKSWLLPVVTTAYGYAFTKSTVAVAILGIVATLVFGLLDIGYLRTERKYRSLYERIAANDPTVLPYSLNYVTEKDTRKTAFLEHCSTMMAWAIWPFYVVLILTGLVAVVVAFW